MIRVQYKGCGIFDLRQIVILNVKKIYPRFAKTFSVTWFTKRGLLPLPLLVNQEGCYHSLWSWKWPLIRLISTTASVWASSFHTYPSNVCRYNDVTNKAGNQNSRFTDKHRPKLKISSKNFQILEFLRGLPTGLCRLFYPRVGPSWFFH